MEKRERKKVRKNNERKKRKNKNKMEKIIIIIRKRIQRSNIIKERNIHTITEKKRITQKYIKNTQKIIRDTNLEEAKETHCIALFDTTIRKGGGPRGVPLFLSSHLFFSLFFFFPSQFLSSLFLFLLVSNLIRFNSSVNPCLLVRLLESLFLFF